MHPIPVAAIDRSTRVRCFSESSAGLLVDVFLIWTMFACWKLFVIQTADESMLIGEHGIVVFTCQSLVELKTLRGRRAR